jgi:hypothetical protein
LLEQKGKKEEERADLSTNTKSARTNYLDEHPRAYAIIASA